MMRRVVIPADLVDVPVIDEPISDNFPIIEILVNNGQRVYTRGASPMMSDALAPIRDWCATQEMITNTWAEFGVAGGNSARQILRHLPEDGKLYLFDHFKGLPEPWEGSMPVPELPEKTLWGPNDKWAQEEPPRFDDPRVEIKEGLFEDTLPLEDLLGFVHIDCDLYSSTKTVLENINVAPGTIILFDELFGYRGWLSGEYKALMEWGVPFEYIARDSQYRAAIKLI